MRFAMVVLSEEEFATMSGLLDAGIRAAGIQAVKSAAKLLDRLDGIPFREYGGGGNQTRPEAVWADDHDASPPAQV